MELLIEQVIVPRPVEQCDDNLMVLVDGINADAQGIGPYEDLFVCGERQFDPERAADPDIAFKADPTGHAFQKQFGHGQANAGAFARNHRIHV